jgi:hypothetical protein
VIPLLDCFVASLLAMTQLPTRPAGGHLITEIFVSGRRFLRAGAFEHCMPGSNGPAKAQLRFAFY